MANKTQGTLTKGRIFSYSLGDVANNLSFQMTSMFLMVYMTDIAGVPAALAGTIYGVTKVWAGVTDLVAGNTVDKADTRWGRLRPWILWGSTPLAVVFVALFSTPAGLSPAMTVAWILLFDAAFQLFYSFVNIPYGVDRSRLSGARSIASATTGVLLSAVVAPQFQNTAADDVRVKFMITTLILAVVAVALYLWCFFNTREVVPRSPGKVKLSNTLKMVGKNRPLIVLCLGAFFLLSAMFTMAAVGMYYARYVLGNASWYTFLMLAQTVGTIAVASSVPAITVKLGKRKGYAVAAAITVLAFALIYFVPEHSLPVAIIAWLLYGIGTGGTNSLMFSMQADTVDYGEWKTGTRSEGGSYSILSFIRKCGQGLGGAVGAAIIGAFGYVAKAPEQTETALQGIRLATGAVPALLAVVAGLVVLAYPLSETQHKVLVAELNERRTQGLVPETAGLPESEVVVPSLGDGRTTQVTTHAAGIAPIVTFFEQGGSGAGVIAPKVAERLGVPFVQQRFSSEQIAQVDTEAMRAAGGFDRFLRGVSFTGAQDADQSVGADRSTDHDLALENTRSVLEAVKDGGVILGRNGAFVLAKAVGALHVRLTAPRSVRIERVAAEAGIDTELAAARLAHEDLLRSEMSQRLYQWDPNDDQFYDLVINTGSFTYGMAVDVVLDVYRSKYPAQKA